MACIRKAVVLAAGSGGRRLGRTSGALPTPLVQLHGRPLLENVLLGAQEAGIEEFVVVLGYCGEVIHSYFAGDPRFEITWVNNPDYYKEDGVSLLAAADVVIEPFLLLTADHLFEPEAASRLLRQLLKHDEVMLAVDTKTHSMSHIDETTKVVSLDNHIIEIGKQLRSHNAVYTGMSLCRPIIFYWLEAVMQNGNCSLSDGLKAMARNRKLKSFDIGNAPWQDIGNSEISKEARYSRNNATELCIRHRF